MSQLLKRSNTLLLLLLLLFIMLYVSDHSKLQTIQNQTVPTTRPDHRTTMYKRRSLLVRVCGQYGHIMRVQHNSLYRRQKLLNQCMGTYFHLHHKDYFICNVLKGGSTSWQVFFGENNISRTVLETCKGDGNCPSTTQLRLVQVRHPLERLLATYRHVFKNGGWKALDNNYQGNKTMEQEYNKFYSKDWPEFVEEVVLRDELHKSEEELEHLSSPGVWVKHHWAPYWYTCGLCAPHLLPDMIIKTETLQWDMPQVMELLQLPRDTAFPDIRVTGTDDNFSEGNKASEEFVEKYFSQLTKLQVMRLYQLYKLDHIMFNYSPKKYIDIATEI